jgi:hypothetical protein
MSELASALGFVCWEQLVFFLGLIAFVGGGVMLLAFCIHLHRPRFPGRYKIIPVDRHIGELWARQIHGRRPVFGEDREAA